MIEPLSSQARQIIAEAHGFDDATSEDRTRVQTRVFSAIAAGTAVSTASNSAQAAGASQAGNSVLQTVGKSLLTLKKLGALVAVAGAGAAGVTLWAGVTETDVTETDVTDTGVVETAVVAVPAIVPTVTEPAIASRSVEEQIAEGEPELGALAQQEVEPAVELQRVIAVKSVSVAKSPVAVKSAKSTKSTKSSRRRPLASAKTEAVAANIRLSGQLGAELLALSAVRSELAGGDPEVALTLLSGYSEEFPAPVFGIEAKALRVDALCEAKHPELSRQEADAFLTSWPKSPLAKRVAQTCR